MAASRPSTMPLPESDPVAGSGFADLGVPAKLVAALSAAGIDDPFPIQTATLPDSLDGRDVLGRGRTGSGKTYAFVIPVVARLAAGPAARPGRPRALILAPTRELATQIEASAAPLAAALGLRTMTIFGGVAAGPQIKGLRHGVDLVIACPGRLADHLETGHVKLDAIEITVLDEADHMADLGFLPVVRRLLDKTPAGGQRLLFSATLDAGVNVLVKRFMNRPVTHSVDPVTSPVATISHHVLHVAPDTRLPVLVDLTAAPGRTLVFTRTKRGAKLLTRKLIASGVPAVELHGNLSQGARTRNLDAFSGGPATTLVATDIAARGIHVDDVTLVIHADPPVEHKAYLHRSGRTARAGASGTVVTLMTDEQVRDVRDLTRKAGIAPTITRLRAGDPLLTELAPGDRTFVAPEDLSTIGAGDEPGGSRSGSGSSRTAPRRTGSGRSGGPRRRGGSSTNGEGPRSGSNGAARTTNGSRDGSPRGGSGNGSRNGAGGGSRGGAGAGSRAGGKAGTATAAGGRRTQGSSRAGGAAAFSAGTRSGRR